MKPVIHLKRAGAAACVVSLLALSAPVWAVDVPNRNPPIEERAMREARAALSASRWALAAELLQAHVKSHLAPFKYPRWVEFLPELPKTATGKIQRFKLRS